MASIQTKGLKILQVNIRRAKVAHDLIYSKALQIDADIIIVPEPNKNISKKIGWISDNRADVAVFLVNNKVCINKITKKEGFLKIKINELAIIACYISPNINMTQYAERVEKIIEASQGEITYIIAGDINAKSILWGSTKNDKRGEIWNEWISSANLTVLDNGKPTFERSESRSHIDITLATNNCAKKISGWDVLDDNIFTFHKYISYEVGIKVTTRHGRKLLEFDKNKFRNQIRNLQEETTNFNNFRDNIIKAHKASSKSKHVTYTIPYW
ncbi:uncharacterized protein [Diabrotica undecimpunctata]|uniref:uncharacterized protein n=1 Tax=Diabrotica undecimpunctata TaxID=50387 RepID=UPI003B6327E1